MNYMKIKSQWIDEYIKETGCDEDDDLSMESVLEWLAKKQCDKAENLSVADASERSGRDLIIQYVDDNGNKQEYVLVGVRTLLKTKYRRSTGVRLSLPDAKKLAKIIKWYRKQIVNHGLPDRKAYRTFCEQKEIELSGNDFYVE